jgi:hypothetical protein
MATVKQRKAIAKIAENGGNVSKAMREVGYSPATASTPGKLTESVGYKELIEEYLPDLHLLDKHREFLDSPRTIKRVVKGIVVEVTEETDTNAVRALDMAYKLKGKYGENTTNNVLIVQVSDASSQRYQQPQEKLPVGDVIL